MSKNEKFFFTISLILAVTAIQANTSTAYTLDWVAVQYRVHESGNQINRLAIEIKDDAGNYVTSASAVTSYTLTDPNGKVVNLSNKRFDPLFDYYPAHLSQNQTGGLDWVYPPGFQISEFYADILDPILTGQYTIQVVMENAQVLQQTINVLYIVDIPPISSRSYQIQSDSDGNVYWTWSIPVELLTLAENHPEYDLQYRAGVAVYNNGQFVALFWPNIPIQMGSSFIPAATYQELLGKGDEIRFTLQVRTRNNNSRAYSNSIPVQDLLAPLSIIPKKSVVVLPMN